MNVLIEEKQILRSNIILFLDNCPSHNAFYALLNLYNLKVKVIFNCACTPAFNLIENVFCDMKFHVRRANQNSAEGLILATRKFLKTIDSNYIESKI